MLATLSMKLLSPSAPHSHTKQRRLHALPHHALTASKLSPSPPVLGWRIAFAGGLAGMLTNIALHPLDTVKTLRQSNPSTYRGVFPAMTHVVRTKGLLALYAGLIPAMVGSALSSALYFSTYEGVKRSMSNFFTASAARAPITALSAACGNIVSSVLFVPKEVVKQRMQSAVTAESSHFFSVASELVRKAGPRGLYRGYKATLLRNIPSTMIRFAVYEELKQTLRRIKKSGFNSSSDLEHVASGAIAGVIASVITTPQDNIKTLFATGKIPIGTSLPAAFQTVIDQRGIQGLFVGIRPRIVWSALFAAVGFSTYELCKSWVSGWPSGPKSVVRIHKPAALDSRQITA